MKTVIVTGVCGGIGRAIAARFAGEGWHVVGVDRDAPAEPLDAVAAFHQLDVTDEAATQKLLGGLTRLDALVNNAALQVAKPLAETSASEWDAVMAVNVKAPFPRHASTRPTGSRRRSPAGSAGG